MSRVATVAAVVVSAATCALAANIPITPKKLIVVDKLSVAGKAKLVFVAKDGAVTKGTGEDVDHIEVQFDVAYADGSAAGAFVVPAGASVDKSPGWLVNKETVAKYVNKTAPEGPTEAKVVVIKPNKLLKLVGRGLGDTDFDILGAGAPDGPVSTAFCVTNAAEENCHCSEFTGCVWKPIGAGSGAKLVCKTGMGDSACSAVPPTTTSTSTSSTTSTSTSSTTTTTVVSGCYIGTALTVIDTCNGLEWEQKDTAVGSAVNSGDLQDVDNPYSWAGACTISGALCQPDAAAAATCAAQTGGALGCTECGAGQGTCNVDPLHGGALTTIWHWVNQVNAAGFAGHGDWRLPTMATYGDAAELETILDLSQGSCIGGSGPCIDPIFTPTQADSYWSASTLPTTPSYALAVHFRFGSVDFAPKDGPTYVRAVRAAP